MLEDDVRLTILRELDTAGDGLSDALEAVAKAAAELCGLPWASVSLVGDDDMVFVGVTGVAVRPTGREVSFSAVALRTPSEPLLVPDTHADPRFAGNVLVTGAPFIRAYAGVPLLSAEGVPLGALCAFGDEPHELTGVQVTGLRSLASVAEELLQTERVTGRLRLAVAQLTAVQKAEQATQAQFRTTFDHATAALTLVDDRGVYVRVNHAFADLLGYPVTELVGVDYRDVTEGEELAIDVQAMAELVAGTRRAVLREKRYRHRDGTLIPALVTSSLIQPVADGPWNLLNTVESLAERRAAEASLIELHSAIDGIVTIDEHSRVIAWNLGAERLLGHSAAAMLGRTLDPILPVAERTSTAAEVAVTLAGKTIDQPVVHADGHELLVALSINMWVQGGRPRYTAILRDITAQRRAEQAASLVRHAAVVANGTDDFTEAAAAIVREVCTRLGWRAGHATVPGDGPAAWYTDDHPHDGDACALARWVSARPFDTATTVWTRAALVAANPAIAACGLGIVVAAPVLTGGEATGTIVFYLPAGSPPPHPDVVGALQQIALTLGRVVERQRSRDTLAWQAGHDPVTELPNRRLLLEHIGRAQRTFAERGDQASAVLLVNLDRFRLINDSLGYAAGDQVLRAVADRMRGALDRHDVVARLSADEFVVLACRSASSDFGILADRLLLLVQQPLHVVGHQLQLRASIGVCPITAEHAAVDHYPARVLRDADAALRQAKRRGRNQHHVFDSALASTTERRLDDETALARAITTGQLVLHYQPIVALNTGTVTGAEALVRWQRPEHGLVPPDQFIAMAEETGLIVDLGRWVLVQACVDAAGWPTTVPAMAEAAISVNVSARQLTHPRFLADLDTALRDSGLAADRLILEITESALIDEPEAVLATLHEVRARGVQVALDDFGTGYSSLSYVQRLPATILKIDKSFVDPITAPGTGTALSEVVIKLAAATGLRTVAEGVETAEQAAALRELGCQRGQGYTWSRPVPQADLAAAVTTLTAAVEPAN